MSNIPNLTSNNWDNLVLNATGVVLIDFWAPWCVPCKMVGKVLDEIYDGYKDKMNFFKVNTDSEQQVAMKYGIRSIPTIMVFKNGQLVEQSVGALSKDKYIKMIEKYL